MSQVSLSTPMGQAPAITNGSTTELVTQAKNFIKIKNLSKRQHSGKKVLKSLQPKAIALISQWL